MHLVFPLLILSLGGPLQTTPLSEAAVNVANWDFEAAGDEDYDGWPDGWRRWRGAGYPAYVGIEIVPEPTDEAPAPGHCLRIELDGGAGRLDSPAVDIHPDFSYVITARIRTLGIRNHKARVAATFCDAQGKTLETHRSGSPPANDVWWDARVGPLSPPSGQARRAVVSLCLEPDQEADLSGSALFDDVRVWRLPRTTLQTNSENGLYLDRHDVEVTCRVSGFSDPHLLVRFALLDAEERILCEHDQEAQFETSLSECRADGENSSPAGEGEGPTAWNGTARWKPPVPGVGFFQVRASLANHDGALVANLAILESFPPSREGEFGWSLPHGEAPLSLRSLSQLVGHAGVHWLKLPVWYDEQRASRGEELARFAERLSAQHVRLIGVLDAPPNSVKESLGEAESLPIASVFVDPAVWRPALDPLFTRLSLAVRWWQLGADQDTSFAGLPGLETKLRKVRDELGRFGQDLDLGLSWRLVDELPSAVGCSFVSFTAQPELTATELLHVLPGAVPGGVQRWVTLEPLSRREYGLRAQTRDLLLRMLAAKQAGARGIFLADPFAPNRGLLTPEGAPDALLLPWRTASLLLSGAEYVGSLQLPGGSQNRVFSRGSEAVVVVWNDRPQREILQLGPSARQFDVWGQTRLMTSREQEGMTFQEVLVDDLPTFFTTADLPLIRWNMAVRLEPAELDSLFGQPQTVVCRFANTFPVGITGSVKLQAPQVWEFDGRNMPLKLAAGEQGEQAFPILLGAGASSGGQPVRLEFALTADREYRFAVYRELSVGLADVRLELHSHLDDDGNLRVEQQLINESNRPVSFHCLLLAPERRRERQQITSLSGGRVTNTFVLPEGRQLLGRTLWLRAEEIGGARILNYHLVAQE